MRAKLKAIPVQKMPYSNMDKFLPLRLIFPIYKMDKLEESPGFLKKCLIVVNIHTIYHVNHFVVYGSATVQPDSRSLRYTHLCYNSVPIRQSFPLLPLPVTPGNHHSVFRLWESDDSGDLAYVELYIFCSFVTGFYLAGTGHRVDIELTLS